MASTSFSRPPTLYIQSVLLLFLSLGAFVGGWNLIADPSGGFLAMTPAVLAGTPFVDFFVPGLFLLIVFGLGSLVALALLWLRLPLGPLDRLAARLLHQSAAWVLTVALGLLLIVWLAVQVWAIKAFHPWQGAMLLIGLMIALLMFEPRTRRYYTQ